jgi:hypothetical protein
MLDSQVIFDLDEAIATLTARKEDWLRVAIPERVSYLKLCIEQVFSVARPWAEAACHAKGLDPNSELAGEEWLAGPAAVMANLRFLVRSLEAGGQPRPVSLKERANGQLVAQVVPDNWMDKLAFKGIRGEVWLEPDKPATQGLVYRQQPATGRVALVLGAGNISSVAPADLLYKLFAEDQTVLLKMNPINDYLKPFFEQAFQPLVADGFLAIVSGGAAVGRYLCHHPKIDTLHITGSHRTYDAIVWGDTLEEQRRRKQENQPVLTKPFTSELGCVTPVLVVPGEWTPADIAFQARHIASMVAHNASFNCAAAKVVVTAKGWSQRSAFLEQLQQEFTRIPPRPAYYPGAQERYQAFLDRYPQAQVCQRDFKQEEAEGATKNVSSHPLLPWTLISDVPPNVDEYALSEEAFCGVLAEVCLDAADAKEFLGRSIEFVNEKVWGNLSCVLLIDPSTQKRYEAELDTAIANLHYGAIAVNAWTAVAYGMQAATWGAFPGNPSENIQSGQGVVHNTYLFEHPQKSVLYVPFRIQPTPVWFVDHQNLRRVAQCFTALQAKPTWGNFLRVGWEAMRG